MWLCKASTTRTSSKGKRKEHVERSLHLKIHHSSQMRPLLPLKNLEFDQMRHFWAFLDTCHSCRHFPCSPYLAKNIPNGWSDDYGVDLAFDPRIVPQLMTRTVFKAKNSMFLNFRKGVIYIPHDLLTCLMTSNSDSLVKYERIFFGDLTLLTSRLLSILSVCRPSFSAI